MENHKQCINKVHDELDLLVKLSYNDPNNKVEIIRPNGEHYVICPIFNKEFAFTKEVRQNYINYLGVYEGN